ncbi:MAG: alpha/beta hydrolase [Chitinophagaceae bacterium]|nr:alpha/beta hydrolase [Chitinophagaceae bacterium]
MKKMILSLTCVFPVLFVFCRNEGLGSLHENRIPGNALVKTTKDSLPWTIYNNVSYGNDVQQKMDVYLPSVRNPKTMTLVIIHGGGWCEGDKSEFNSYVAEFQKRLPEYAIANFNYRLVKNNENYFPTQENDIVTAIEFLKSKAQDYNISTDFILFGMSAGGHLALLHGYKHNDIAQIKGIISVFGPSDLLQLYGNGKTAVSKNLQTCINATPETNPGIYDQSNPINFITSHSAPTLMLHGDKDTIISIEQAYRLRDRLAKNSVVNKLVVYSGQGHGFTGNELTDLYQQVAIFVKELGK